MRENDENSSVRHFRTANRFFCQDGQWWFSTREGEEGPFNSREHAEEGMQRYVDSVRVMANLKAEKSAELEILPKERGDPTIWDRQIDSI